MGKAKLKTGRPSEYAHEKAAEICGRLAEGESLRSICRSDEMPDVKTVYRWMLANAEFRQQYALAREDQADTHADEIIDIADNATAEEVNKARLQVDARKWVAAKLKPKKYGDKVTNEHSGPDGGAIPNKWTIEFMNASPTDKPGPRAAAGKTKAD